MRISFFDVSPAEQELMKQRLSAHECLFEQGSLSAESVSKAVESDAVCVFVNCEVNAAVIDALPKLKLIATRSTGYDHIDVAHAVSRGITVVTVPAYGSHTVAEFAFGLMLSLSRKIFAARLRLLQGADFSITDLEGFDLFGKTLGVVGTGRIGKNVITIAKGFGMEVQAHDPHPDVNFAATAGYRYVSLEELLPTSDVVSLHVPSTKETHHLINAGNIGTLKKGALIINTARGDLIETDAVVRALESGHLGGVGLDVLEGEHLLHEEAQLLRLPPEKLTDFKLLYEDHVLMDHPKAILTPHIAFFSKEAAQEIMDTTLHNIEAFARGAPENVVRA